MNLTARYHDRKNWRGFTLIELLVVIGIITILIGLVAVAGSKALRSARKARAQADLQTIAVALQAYRQDFGDYPRLEAARTTNNPADLIPPTYSQTYMMGYEVLCWALVGPYDANTGVAFHPGDGADGPGFRKSRSTGGAARGQVWGPYISVDKFKIGVLPIARYQAILDTQGMPILYYAASTKKPNIRNANALASRGGIPKADSWYDPRDNEAAFCRTANLSDYDPAALNRFQVMLGDSNLSGHIDLQETPNFVGDFLLYGAGDDQLYGVTDPTDSSQVKACDDVLLSTGE